MQAENQHLRIRVQELEVENALLVEQLQAMPVLYREQLIEMRDHTVGNWRVAKAPEKEERIKEALDRFIEAIVA